GDVEETDERVLHRRIGKKRSRRSPDRGGEEHQWESARGTTADTDELLDRRESHDLDLCMG
ncbi:MAG: hypothetical protein ACR2OI_01750, partial [Acidimicrobiia bacterium]